MPLTTGSGRKAGGGPQAGLPPLNDTMRTSEVCGSQQTVRTRRRSSNIAPAAPAMSKPSDAGSGVATAVMAKLEIFALVRAEAKPAVPNPTSVIAGLEV